MGILGRLANLARGGASASVSSLRARLGDLVAGRARDDVDGDEPLTVITDLAPPDHVRMDAQRARVLALARERWPNAELVRAEPDLDVLQKLVDADVLHARDDLHAAGVVLGDVLESELGMRWVMVMDERTGHCAVRWKDSDVTINPGRVLVERAAAGRVDVFAVLEQVRAAVRG